MTRPPTGVAYDEIAERWSDARFDNNNGIAQHERALRFVPGPGLALNVGCGGNTRLNPLLGEVGLGIHGIDVSAKMIAMARAADPTVTLYQADIVDWILPEKYKFITAWDSLWHVQLDRQEAVMKKLMAGLAPGGVFIFSAGGLDTPSEHTNTVMGPEIYYSTLGIPETMRVIGESNCVCRHLEFDAFPEQHVYYIVQRRW